MLIDIFLCLALLDDTLFLNFIQAHMKFIFCTVDNTRDQSIKHVTQIFFPLKFSWNYIFDHSQVISTSLQLFLIQHYITFVHSPKNDINHLFTHIYTDILFELSSSIRILLIFFISLNKQTECVENNFPFVFSF